MIERKKNLTEIWRKELGEKLVTGAWKTKQRKNEVIVNAGVTWRAGVEDEDQLKKEYLLLIHYVYVLSRILYLIS